MSHVVHTSMTFRERNKRHGPVGEEVRKRRESRDEVVVKTPNESTGQNLTLGGTEGFEDKIKGSIKKVIDYMRYKMG